MDTALTSRLKQDMQTVVTDAEELLKATAAQTGERMEKVRARAEDSLRKARLRLAEAGAMVGEKARVAADGIDDHVHRHPYATAGMAACAGLLLGLLLSRR